VRAVYDRRGRARLVLTTARGHQARRARRAAGRTRRGAGRDRRGVRRTRGGARRVRPGLRRRAVRRSFPAARRAGRGRLGAGRFVFGVRGGRITYLAVADRATAARRGPLGRRLRAAGAR